MNNLSVQPMSGNRYVVTTPQGNPLACVLTPKSAAFVQSAPRLIDCIRKMIANDPEQNGAKEALEILTQIRRTR